MAQHWSHLTCIFVGQYPRIKTLPFYTPSRYRQSAFGLPWKIAPTRTAVSGLFLARTNVSAMTHSNYVFSILQPKLMAPQIGVPVTRRFIRDPKGSGTTFIGDKELVCDDSEFVRVEAKAGKFSAYTSMASLQVTHAILFFLF